MSQPSSPFVISSNRLTSIHENAFVFELGVRSRAFGTCQSYATRIDDIVFNITLLTAINVK